jgi:hypothetical protein
MKAFLLSFVLATRVAFSDPLPTSPTAPPPATPTAPSADAASSGEAANPAAPSPGYPASRYEVLWTKSPFAVATSEDATVTSPDYMLVGVSIIDGVSYASVIEKQNQEHFLISSDKAARGMTLTSITRSHDSPDTYAVVQKDGQSLTLKLEQAPAGQPGVDLANGAPGGQIMTPQISMPGGAMSNPMRGPNSPFTVRFHRPLINLPPRPGQQLPSQQPAPQAVQVHPQPPTPQ